MTKQLLRSPSSKLLWATAVSGVLAAATYLRDDKVHVQPGAVASELPTYSWQQVRQQSGGSRPAWVIYRNGVYDVTDFAATHPGGNKILQAAGKSLELFWRQSEPHLRAGVAETLEQLRIGNLSQQDVDQLEQVKQTMKTLETYFFIEEKAETPEVDTNSFELEIVTLDGGQTLLSLEDLKTFKQHQVTTTIRCSSNGNSRVPAKWGGVLLADVLTKVGITCAADIHDVRFEALDFDKHGRAFGSSIPVATALDEDVGVLLAFEMDDAPIPKEHGFPLRVIVPGTTGARNVKFVHRIIVK